MSSRMGCKSKERALKTTWMKPECCLMLGGGGLVLLLGDFVYVVYSGQILMFSDPRFNRNGVGGFP
jgi:hypothetical protein